MLKHILVALDGSELAEHALDYAARLLAPGAEITLLSIVDVPNWQIYTMYDVPMAVAVESGEDMMARLQREGLTYLGRIEKDLKTRGFTVHKVLEVGEPATEIVAKAVELGVDAIVMSTHGRSGISRWLFGSVTQRVLEAMPCPVFVVPNQKLAQTNIEKVQSAER